MLFSFSQLKELVDLEGLTSSDIKERLTFAGFEVEGVEQMAIGSNLVIGEIVSEEKHPDSDHLHLLKVDCGKEGVLDIVCGAPNARKGIKVIVALPSCVLKGGVIKKSRIRGYESNGMCCSLAELGVDEALLETKQVQGIEELPSDAPVGSKDVLSYLGLDDEIFDINVLPNRPDCLSYYGIAREISSLTGRKLLIDLPAIDSSIEKKTIPESLTDSCPRFDLLSLRNVRPRNETPIRIRRFLQASQVRPISPIVDLGNYVMLLTGQPLNMYDASSCPEGKYYCRDDYQGEFIAFDGKKHELVKGDIVICSDKDILCLAGIQAAEKGKITDDTKDVDIELASFSAKSIRHTTSRLGLSSFASTLFAKGRNPLMIDEAVAVTISVLPLFLEKFEVVSYASFNKIPTKSVSFPFSCEKLNHRLGSSYTKKEIDLVLERYRIERKGELLYPPVDRVDLLEQCDIDEEVFRFYGQGRIESSLVGLPVTSGHLDPREESERRIERLLADRSYLQCITYSLLSEKEDKAMRVFSDKEGYKVKNPMTKDHEYVRSDLMSSMLLAMKRNVSKQKNDLHLFEISDVDTIDGVRTYLCIGEHGKNHACDFYKEEEISFFSLKGTVESVLSALGLASNRYRLQRSTLSFLHPYASAEIYIGKILVGVFGLLSPDVEKTSYALAELDLTSIWEMSSGKTKAVSYSSFAPLRRDFSFITRDGVSFEDIRKCILSLRDPYVVDVKLFDLFKNQERSTIGVSLLIKGDSSLSDQQISEIVEKCKNKVEKDLKLSLGGK